MHRRMHSHRKSRHVFPAASSRKSRTARSDSAAADTIALDLGVFRESKYARGVWSLSPDECVVNPARVTGVTPDGAITRATAAIVRE